MRRTLFVALLLLALPAFARAGKLVPLSAADVPALLKPPAHGMRILAIWSLDCAYCEANMQTLAKWQRTHPHDIELVTVATDDVAQGAALEARLKAAHMEAYPALAYVEGSPERLDFLIDPDWGGETPRTEIIRSDGTRQGISGEITAAQLQGLP
ncbi:MULTISPECIES: thioredoxin domain-containing protein [Rhodanobacter]|uniref:Thioredoxin domain-containing protein n=1 Tax=Rhodanobacter hydrolyticus TaxID=2250595 RepID=A0ABW8J7X0_9GAMM|nr:hypothetical protein [Rhodanobacter sp. 7MK24]MBD8879094.1 hypothetical protein [Rhodanobacter sp. 7MK24]